MSIFSKIFKSYSEKEVKRITWMVDKINDLEPEMEKLSDKELSNKTNEFKERLANGETVDDILIPAFAVCREASKRVLGMRHFDVQLIGGIILHQGRIAEMKTGEGKTLVATLPVYLNALTGKGVHVVTVNDYLAKRDSEWMGKLYNFLGLSVGLIISGMEREEKQQAYNSDITYGTNNEYGFDYLRDNMVINKKDMVQRELNFAIVDEIDSILIDEARTPLIISGQGEKSSELYKVADHFAKGLRAKTIVESDDKQEETEEDKQYDYIIDLKAKSATLTENGIKKAEKYFNVADISDIENTTLLHHINQAIRANGIMKRDIDYVVKDGEVLIVDEFTGRIMIGRRYNEGLHQAIEAKENVKVANESKTLATITFQNYFRLYNKIAGMTGTAMTEEKEFRYTYNLDVVSIPTNKPISRKDLNDQVYKNERGKFTAIVNEVKQSHEKGQPVLVGTVTIEKSEELSKLLKKEGIKHEVLNAKYHEKEAEIIAQAGKLGAVTIATNMAGRGTDIMLGGNSEYLAKIDMKKQGYDPEIIEAATAYNETDNEEILSARKEFRNLKEKYENEISDERQKVIEAGGLKIIGTERHESRRIDNQLRGRSGRQGDPGETRFFISLEDDLMKLFGPQRMTAIYNAMQIPEDMPIEHNLLSGTIETAQKTIEGRHFSQRKNVLRFDDVMNQQRKIMYEQRRKVLDGENMKDTIIKMRDSLIEEYVEMYCQEAKDNWNLELLYAKMKYLINEDLEQYNIDVKNSNEMIEKIKEIANNKYAEKEQIVGEEKMRAVERLILLQTVDEKWMAHIDDMDQLKNGIGLRGYAQRDPIYEYAQEGADMFEEMNHAIKEDTVSLMNRIKLQNDIQMKSNVVITGTSGGDNTVTKEPVKKKKEVGRNEPCPCGSGKKYKQCCGK
ncbi:MAG: preprotein translocase subunit SecA [Clostridiales bacterium]|nr:preprotein translocase subunit SecA [Clostridiales bacterium]